MPTPAVFQMDFVCNDKLATAPKAFKGTPADDAPAACGFHCRDKLPTPMCEEQATKGLCKEAATAKTMRFQCASTCGVCKGLGVPSVERESLPFPNCAKADVEGDQCPKWAAAGECVNNFDYMKDNCALACGLCAEDGKAPVPMADALVKKMAVPPPGGGKKKCKKGKKGKKCRAKLAAEEAAAGEGSSGAAAAEDDAGDTSGDAAEEEPAEAEEAAEAGEPELPEMVAAPASGGAASAGEAEPSKKKGMMVCRSPTPPSQPTQSASCPVLPLAACSMRWQGHVRDAIGKIPGMKKKKDEL